MKLLSSILLILILLLIITANELYSQSELDSPLEAFPVDRSSNYTGVFFGLGANFQTGEYQPVCDNCLFDEASGFGFTAGLILNEQFLTNSIAIGGAAGIDYMSQSGAYRSVEAIQYRNAETNEILTKDGIMRYEAETSYMSFVFMPYIKWEPAEVFFFRVGFTGLIPISSEVYFTENPAQNIIKDPDGTIYAVEADLTVIDDGEVEEVNSFLMYLNPAIGFNIDLANDIQFSPIFQYNIPVSNISESGNNYQLHSWRIMFELRIFSASIF